MMKKIFELIEKYLVPTLTRIGEEKHLKGIRNGLMLTIPFIIVGSAFMIVRSFPVAAWKELIAPFSSKLLVPISVTFDMLSIIAAIGVGYNLAKQYKMEPITGALISMVSFLATQVNEEYKLSTANFGASGIFTAILAAIVSIEIYKYFVKKNLVIKLPDNVPPAIANSFMSLTPAAVSLVLFWFVRVVLGFDISAFLTMIFSPLVFGLNTLPGILIYMLLMCLLWTVGIHGDSIVGSISAPIFIQYIGANAEAFVAGNPIPYITAKGFVSFFVNVGGTGATLALVLLMLWSKDKTYKQMGKISFPSAIFNINEPVIFGFPIVLNPIMMIPFIVVPLILATCSYLLMYFNIIGRPVVLVPWTMPIVLSNFLATGGDWRAAVWGAVAVLISAVCYLPFFRIAEKQQEKLESQEN